MALSLPTPILHTVLVILQYAQCEVIRAIITRELVLMIPVHDANVNDLRGGNYIRVRHGFLQRQCPGKRKDGSHHLLQRLFPSSSFQSVKCMDDLLLFGHLVGSGLNIDAFASSISQSPTTTSRCLSAGLCWCELVFAILILLLNRSSVQAVSALAGIPAGATNCHRGR